MPERLGIVVKANGHWFVGPDNGLFDLVLKQDSRAQCWEITWQPDRLSNSFHGRDLFAPIAAELELDIFSGDKLRILPPPEHTAADFDYAYVVYIDHFGNLISGIRAEGVSTAAVFTLCGKEINYARTFGEVASSGLFWYKNSNGLVEIAANASSAADMLNASIGDVVTLR
ncbi:hypothetical protein MNBD_GAMMA17-951 [hydrothermal vent metagenome]|uniref:Uncharacterized protein n=1 Tax=hydrothermal vent metagenome TaxID=652676 RepID=A0A3B0Z1X0_9ZZZZ